MIFCRLVGDGAAILTSYLFKKLNFEGGALSPCASPAIQKLPPSAAVPTMTVDLKVNDVKCSVSRGLPKGDLLSAV